MTNLIFDINLFISNEILSFCLSTIYSFVGENVSIVYSIIIIGALSFIMFSKSNIIKNVGKVGTAVLAGVGAVDSTLNIYDRIISTSSNEQTGNESNTNTSSDNSSSSNNSSGGNTSGSTSSSGNTASSTSTSSTATGETSSN